MAVDAPAIAVVGVAALSGRRAFAAPAAMGLGTIGKTGDDEGGDSRKSGELHKISLEILVSI